MPKRKPDVADSTTDELLEEFAIDEGPNDFSLGFPPEYEADILKFYPPAKPTTAQAALVVQIVTLDHRSIYNLRPRTAERLEVKRLLHNAVVTGFEYGQMDQGALLYKEAEKAYWDHLQAKNRIKYLLGMLAGVVLVALLVGAFLGFYDYFTLQPSRPYIIMLVMFAGMGSIASILTRLSSLDLRQNTSASLVLISGIARPVVAILFAIVVYIILDIGIIDVKFGSDPAGKRDSLYLVTAFLCGFSERFAKDIIARVPFVSQDEPGDSRT